MKFSDKIKKRLHLKRKNSQKVIIGAVLIILLVIVAKQLTKSDTADTPTVKPVVTTTPVEYSDDKTLSVIGTVRAFSEAAVTTEVAGRVTSVNVQLGDEVEAGRILVTLENASERASALQAQGAYEAALAAAARDNVGVEQSKTQLAKAQDGAITMFKSAYNTTNGTILNTIDNFFASPDARVPGLRIDGRGQTAAISAERVQYQTLLSEWLQQVNTISTDSDLESKLAYAKQNVQKTINFVDTFITLFNNQDNNGRYSDSELLAFSTTYTALRANLIATESGIDNAAHALQSSEDSLEQARLSASGGTISAADAQVKQAQGSLAAAQANLSKTILRTPIGGTVNSIAVRTGDFIGSFIKIAEVANNTALEIITFVDDSTKDLLTIGDEVILNEQFTGTVTQIAPSINSETRKTEVRIATDGTDINNGDTVRITKKIEKTSDSSSEIWVPLTSIKFNRENGFMLGVVNNTLVEVPVVLGKINGGSVVITEGLSSADTFVTDVRGLAAGEEVSVIE